MDPTLIILSISLLCLLAAYVGYWTGRLAELEAGRRRWLRDWREADQRARIHHARHLRDQTRINGFHGKN
jgi:membrane protein DedA with SNARE-associated domain